MLNKEKICVASVDFRIFRKFKTNTTNCQGIHKPSPNNFYESESQRHECEFESSKSGLESGLGLESSQLCRFESMRKLIFNFFAHSSETFSEHAVNTW